MSEQEVLVALTIPQLRALLQLLQLGKQPNDPVQRAHLRTVYQKLHVSQQGLPRG